MFLKDEKFDLVAVTTIVVVFSHVLASIELSRRSMVTGIFPFDF